MVESTTLDITRQNGSAPTLPNANPFGDPALALVDAVMPDAAATIEASSVRTCKRCRREGRPFEVHDPGAQVCPRCKCALKGNWRTTKHGLRSRPELHPETANVLRERTAQIIRDGGYTSQDAPAIVYASLAADFTRLEAIAEDQFIRIAEGGSSAKDRDQYVSLILAKSRLAQALGLERRSRSIKGMSAEQYAAVQERSA
jgi:hypothetical protein